MTKSSEKGSGLKPRIVYYYAISLLGLAILAYAIIQLRYIEQFVMFFLFLLLGVLTQAAATTATIKSRTGITYALSPAVSLAAVPFFGVGAAVLIEAVTSLTLWLIKPADKTSWKKSRSQLFFNASMSIISIFVAGSFFTLTQAYLGGIAFLGLILPWFVGAVFLDQTNLWLIVIMLRLQHGPEFQVSSLWRENAWAIPISVLTVSIGGGFLAYSYSQLSWIGIAIFFLPLFLSAYAIRLYVSQMQAHMDNLENIIAERTEALQNLMREKDSFLAVLTHDMKSPLTTIGLYAGILRDKPGLLLERPNITDSLSQSQETLLNIVNNILDLEKMQTDGSFKLEKEKFDLAMQIEAVTEILRVQAEEKDITLKYCPNLRSLPIMADRQQIERIMHNLISNAVKYTPKGQEIFIKLRSENDTAVIDVIDTGYGIPADELPYVFERFRRVKKHKKAAAGTGLGLAITKALVEAHDGQISVTSEEDKGSHFTLTLPLEVTVP